MSSQNRSSQNGPSQNLDPWLNGRSFDDCYQQYDEEGYVVFEGIMAVADVTRVRDALSPHLTQSGRNNFEGFKSNRVYSLLAKAAAVFSDMVTHPLALAFAERELGESCLLSALLAINLQPGETVQDWHHDDNHLSIALPHPAYAVSTFWAIDEMTEDNGATEIIPRSHLWTEAERIQMGSLAERNQQGWGDVNDDVNHDPCPRSDSVKAIMPAGSLMVAKGTLFHRGGANRSDQARLIVTPQYGPGWARQLENIMATTPRKVAARLPKRTRELIGYSIHGAFMGYVDGVHPDKLLHQVRPD